MSDEFFEWDRFYEMYERSLTPLKAMERYKKRRRLIEARRNRIAKLEATIAQRRAASSSIQARSAGDVNSEMKTLPGSDATKNN